MMEQLEGQTETIRELNERIAVLEADKKEVDKKKAEAWKIIYAKDAEVKKLKEQLEESRAQREHEKSERENKDAKMELLLKKHALEMKHAGRFFYCFQYLCTSLFLFYSIVLHFS